MFIVKVPCHFSFDYCPNSAVLKYLYVIQLQKEPAVPTAKDHL